MSRRSGTPQRASIGAAGDAAHHGQRGDRLRHHAAGVHHGAAADRHVGQQQRPRADVGVVIDAHRHLAGAHGLALLVGDDRGPRADLDP
ncbi:MAG: hypothetical protein R2736_06985 [Solirubrobacterales bacterium]